MVFDNLLNPVLSPLLNLPPLLSILIISLILSLLMTFIYKWMTDQELMKTLKEDIKSLQKEMKQFKDNPSKMMEINKKAMEKNMKYMMHSMKPTLVTFIPLIIIFAWLSSHFAYYPLVAGEQFTIDATFEEGTLGDILLDSPNGVELLNDKEQKIVNDESRWMLKGEPGTYKLKFTYDDRQFTQDILIVENKDNWEYKNPLQKIKDSNLKQIMVENEKVTVINLFGWEIGWLGTYILFSIAFSMSLRKI